LSASFATRPPVSGPPASASAPSAQHDRDDRVPHRAQRVLDQAGAEEQAALHEPWCTM
jgi:hypothetical protein